MKRIEGFKCLKRIVMGSLVAVVVIAGLTLTPKAAEKKITYDKMAMSEQIPTKTGYIFAGWYSDEEGTTPVKQVTSADGYAKFVPAEMLSVKTQAKTTLEATNYNDISDGESLRVLSAVDSKNYQEVGFKIIYGVGEVRTDTIKISTVYHKLTVLGDNNTTYDKSAEEVFGTGAKYFFAVNITNIMKKNASSQIYVQPYWVTLDGTTVYGQASNVFLEDHCADKNYYRASVNLFGGQDVAAGKVSVKYDSNSFEVVDVKVGRMFKNEIESNAGNGTVTIVGNAATVNTHEQASDLLMTVRFTKKANATNVNFTDVTSEFCDWNEKDVTGIVVQ